MTPDALFETDHFRVREIRPDSLDALQRFLEANPSFYRLVNRREVASDEAWSEYGELPPPHLSYTRRWFCGIHAREGQLCGLLIAVSDLAIQGVWHIAFLLIADSMHRRGHGSEVYRGFEAWARRGGASWLRLSVVVGNTGAERFWEAVGFTEVRKRLGVDTGGAINDMRVMIKSLSQAPIEDYLARAPRDRPEPDTVRVG